MSFFQAPFSPFSYTWSWHTTSGKKPQIYYIRSGPRKFSLLSRVTPDLNLMFDFHLCLLDSVWDQSTFSLTRHCRLTERERENEWKKWVSKREWVSERVCGGVHTGMCVCACIHACVHACVYLSVCVHACLPACLCTLGKILKITHSVYQFIVNMLSSAVIWNFCLPACLLSMSYPSLPPSNLWHRFNLAGCTTVYQLLSVTQLLYLHHNTPHRTPLSPLALAADRHTDACARAHTHTHRESERESERERVIQKTSCKHYLSSTDRKLHYLW